jgi:hypothetical protein
MDPHPKYTAGRVPGADIHVQAQNFNNRAASFLITPTSSSSAGNNYDEGIFLLLEALKLTEQDYHDEIKNERSSPSSSSCCTRSPCSCSCQYCSLESCLTMDGCNNDGSSTPVAAAAAAAAAVAADEGINSWFVYRKPIFVNKDCIEGMHFMGATLSIIILFNLALAHHLKAIAGTSTTNTTSYKLLLQALQLYKLAYQLHVDIIHHSQQQQQPSSQDNKGATSLRLTMIIFNNLGDIHRITGDKEKHIMCLQHLLTLIMFILDSSKYKDTYSSSAGEYYATPNSTEMMDGFHQNVSAIMFGYENHNTSSNVYALAA